MSHRFRSAAAVVAIALVALPVLAGSPKSKLDPPTLTCAGSTQTSISLLVSAGASGAPAGFSIQ